jgi:hypothetical protein
MRKGTFENFVLNNFKYIISQLLSVNIFVLVQIAHVAHTSDFKRKYTHLYLCLHPPTS